MLVTREPAVIQAVLSDTGDALGQFDRNTRPARGIARSTEEKSLFYADRGGSRRQKKIAAPPFTGSPLFQSEKFGEFERTFRIPSQKGERRRDILHFGFGHDARFRPGKFLAMLEVALVVGAFVKLFKISALTPSTSARVGVPTKPSDGVQVTLQLRKRP